MATGKKRPSSQKSTANDKSAPSKSTATKKSAASKSAASKSTANKSTANKSAASKSTAGKQRSAEPRYPVVHMDVPSESSDEAAAALFSLGASGVEERDAATLDKPSEGEVLLVAHFDDEDRARIACGALPWPGRLTHIVGDDWKHNWRAFFKPTRIGKRLVIRPSWEEVTPKKGDVIITVDPGQAFGTGTHETTRLVLAELDACVRGGERVLDAGCGSGILAIGALLLGAKDALCVDVDPDAIVVTLENAEINDVADRVVANTTPVAKLRRQFDLVVANIESRVLIPMAPQLAKRVAPGGTLVLSGLLAPEEVAVRKAYRGLGLRYVRTRQDGEWIALSYRAARA